MEGGKPHKAHVEVAAMPNRCLFHRTSEEGRTSPRMPPEGEGLAFIHWLPPIGCRLPWGCLLLISGQHLPEKVFDLQCMKTGGCQPKAPESSQNHRLQL